MVTSLTSALADPVLIPSKDLLVSGHLALPDELASSFLRTEEIADNSTDAACCVAWGSVVSPALSIRHALRSTSDLLTARRS
jgi:hypothetical protein